MPSEMVRIFLDMRGNHYTVEYGERRAAGLTHAQQEERTQLIEDLEGFSDFTVAEKIGDEERQALMVKKKRLVELNEMEELEHIDWRRIDEHLIESLLIVVSPRDRHTYVENLPAYLLDRILDPKGNITISISGATTNDDGQGLITTPEAEKTEKKMKEHLEEKEEDIGDLQSHTAAEIVVIKVIAQDTRNWADLLTVKEMPERRLVFVRPNKFLGNLWPPINRALRELYGECWKSEGTGDKDAHWELPI